MDVVLGWKTNVLFFFPCVRIVNIHRQTACMHASTLVGACPASLPFCVWHMRRILEGRSSCHWPLFLWVRQLPASFVDEGLEAALQALIAHHVSWGSLSRARSSSPTHSLPDGTPQSWDSPHRNQSLRRFRNVAKIVQGYFSKGQHMMENEAQEYIATRSLRQRRWLMFCTYLWLMPFILSLFFLVISVQLTCNFELELVDCWLPQQTPAQAVCSFLFAVAGQRVWLWLSVCRLSVGSRKVEGSSHAGRRKMLVVNSSHRPKDVSDHHPPPKCRGELEFWRFFTRNNIFVCHSLGKIVFPYQILILWQYLFVTFDHVRKSAACGRHRCSATAETRLLQDPGCYAHSQLTGDQESLSQNVTQVSPW